MAATREFAGKNHEHMYFQLVKSHRHDPSGFLREATRLYRNMMKIDPPNSLMEKWEKVVRNGHSEEAAPTNGKGSGKVDSLPDLMPEHPRKLIANLIKQMGVTQGDFGFVIGVSRNTVNNWVNETMFPSPDSWLKVVTLSKSEAERTGGRLVNPVMLLTDFRTKEGLKQAELAAKLFIPVDDLIAYESFAKEIPGFVIEKVSHWAEFGFPKKTEQFPAPEETMTDETSEFLRREEEMAKIVDPAPVVPVPVEEPVKGFGFVEMAKNELLTLGERFGELTRLEEELDNQIRTFQDQAMEAKREKASVGDRVEAIKLLLSSYGEKE